jgi:hypothetical protein
MIPFYRYQSGSKARINDWAKRLWEILGNPSIKSYIFNYSALFTII